MKKLFLLLCATAGLMWADCVDGLRKPTPAEKKMFDEVAAAISATLPAPPQSWRTSGDGTQVREPALCTGTPVAGFPIGTTVVYRYLNPPKRRDYPEEAEMKKLQDEITAMTSMPAEVRKQYNDVMAQQSEKRRASRAAEKAGNKEEARRLRSEADEISKGADKIRADYLASIGPKVKEREAKIRELKSRVPDYNTEVTVSLVVNERKQVPPAGNSLNQDVYVFGAAAPAKNSLTVQNVVLRISGWPDYREIIGGKTDRSRLSALVK